MRVLVTGGAGFLGRHTIRQLIDAGHEPRCLDPGDWPEAPEPVDLRRGSILDETALDAALTDVEAVIHLAAFPHLWARDAAIYQRLNHQGTRTVLRRARALGVRRFLYVASPTVFAARRLARLGRAIVEEDGAEPFELPDGYARSKRRAELATLASNAPGFETLSLIPTIPIGPGDHAMTPPTRMIADFAAGRTPAYLDCWMGLVDVRSAAHSLVVALDRGEAGERYILCDESLRLGALLDRLASVVGRPRPRARVPGWAALVAAQVSEGAARWGGPAPVAPKAGVVSARRARPFDASKARRILETSSGDLDQALGDAVADLRRRGAI